ncbi:MAG: tetratricopeptide repeat protein [Sedimentisphaerales bacterium]|nr:tetratricopeptide repeat protein [Sedimentisphaerales bacterium]
MKNVAFKNWLLAGALVIITSAAYWPAVRAGFIWDDDRYVTENYLISEPDGLRRIWFSQDAPSQYFPMTYTTFRIEYALWKFNPIGYHIVNILLHAVNAILVWQLLKRLSIPAAWFAAAVWALHPVNVESVAWITERKNILMMLFSLLSLLAWSKFAEFPERGRRRWYFYAASILLYTIALFSKATACTLPAGLLLILWLKRIPISIKRWLQIAPFVILGIAMGIFIVWWERIHQNTQLIELDLNLMERILLASRALWFYLWKLIWPFNLSFSYPKWEIDWTEPIQYIWLFACLITVLFTWLWRKKIGRGPIAAIVFFAATLFPMLGFFSLYTFLYTYVADHYQYLACIGPISVAVAAAYLATIRFGKMGEKTAVVAGVCILVLLGVLTYRQCHIYKNEEILWRDTLRKNPESWLAHTNLARQLGLQGNLDEALGHCREALRIVPNNVNALYNLGVTLGAQGHLDEAIGYFQQAIQNMNKYGESLLYEDTYADVYTDLGLALAKQGKLEQAYACFRKALEIEPRHFRAQLNLSVLCAQRGETNEALLYIEKALKINPNSAEANRFRQKLLKQDQLQKAVEHYEQILKSRPNDADAHNALGELFMMQGKFEESITHFSEALRLRPDWASPMNNLAYILAVHPDGNIRNADKAVSLAERAADLTKHENVEILDTLAAAYASAGEFDKAAVTAQKALDLSAATGETKILEAIKTRLDLYKQGKPYRIVIDNNKEQN